jgi:hypothetical protein
MFAVARSVKFMQRLDVGVPCGADGLAIGEGDVGMAILAPHSGAGAVPVPFTTAGKLARHLSEEGGFERFVALAEGY